MRKEERRIGAQERAELRQSRSDEEQLKVLEGRGHGNCAEVERLRKRIQVRKKMQG
jgi:hypothetical protein